MAIGYLIVGIVIFVSVAFTLIVGLSARKIDFSDRIINPRTRERLLDRISRRDSGPMADIPPPSPSPESYKMTKRAKGRSEPSKKIDKTFDEEPVILSDFAPKDEEILDEAKEEIEGEESFRSSFIAPPPPPPDEELLAPIEGEETILGEEPVVTEDDIEVEEKDLSRDLSIQLPKNMCIDEVFRLKITLIKSEEFSEDLTLKELELDKTEAKYFSLNVTKLGEKVVEATTRITGLKEGSLIIRPIAVGNVAVIAPGQRTIYFDTEEDEIIIEFFITPTRWSTDVLNVLRIEFEQNYRIIKTINVPMKIYKRKLEAIFGFNISKWHQYALFIYSAIGTIAGLISTLQERFVPWIQALFS
ncbi:MAG: hypothetical protein ACFFDS_09220 [Candidatus Thorarchaeota archaeon]